MQLAVNKIAKFTRTNEMNRIHERTRKRIAGRALDYVAPSESATDSGDVVRLISN